mmetsp:Transcript_10061/g.22374  ORF Transcript_10061/g.22374 Transcript_10061/m.22374 type:complete len:240 (-) Transcript_10061:182-901(-)
MTLSQTITALSTAFTFAGNSGVSPFLTLFIIGAIEKADPTLLDMDTISERILASWPSLVVLSIFSIGEFVGKCVPVLDELIDSAEIFVVPFISIIASLSATGLLSADSTDDDEHRNLSIASNTLVFLKTVVVLVGMGLALGIHLMKMLLRLFGQGCFTGCITVVEVFFVVVTVTAAVYVEWVAIFVAACMFILTGYILKRKYLNKKSSDADNLPNRTAESATSSLLDNEIEDGCVAEKD